MISYREKELLMVMKILQEETEHTLAHMQSVLRSMNTKEKQISVINTDSRMCETYDELVDLAKQRGYDLYIRAEDVLTAEELKDLVTRKKDIESEFKKKVKLKGGDYVFLFSAVALQLAKQIFLTIDLDKRDQTADQTDKDYEKKYDKKENIDGTEKAKLYYAPTQQILNTKTVPYDIVKNTKYFNKGTKETGLGLNGNNHRFKSVGHDPLLGLVIGTSNILTNTATFYTGEHTMRTFHVAYDDMFYYKKAYIKSNASTALMLTRVQERYQKDHNALKYAFVKELAHIESDKKSIAGIPLPFLTLLFGDEKAKELTLKGFDLNTFEKGIDVGKQAGVTILINLIISWLHKLYILWDEVKDTDGSIEKVKTYLNTQLNDFDSVRTKKIIMYSNLIASSVNLAVCVGGGVACSTSNLDLSKKLLSHTDIGGLMVTICTLFKDSKFILKVKDDFIKETINNDFNQKLAAIEKELQL